jgi:SAM-dependent methyltransferase
MTGEVFGDYSAYYDLLYRDKDYRSEVDYVVRTLRGVNPHVRTLLEFGSGTGRHGRLLAQDGFRVLGIERSRSMLSRAQATSSVLSDTGGSFECKLGDLRDVQLDRTCDAVIALFHVISYQTSDEDLADAFGNAARHLSPAGVFLFDVWHGPAVLAQRPSIREVRMEDETLRLTRLCEPALDTCSRTVAVRYTLSVEDKATGQITSLQEDHRLRYFFPEEVTLLAERAGFRIERCEEFLTARAVSTDTWGVAYLLRKT